MLGVRKVHQIGSRQLFATSTFGDVLLAAVSEVGDSREEGKDGQGGLLGYLKMCSVLERKTTLILVGRILPLKISTEVKQVNDQRVELSEHLVAICCPVI
jgi:hypothetical protein